MANAIRAGLALTGCCTACICIAQPSADRIVAATGDRPGFYSAASVPIAVAPSEAWHPVAELLSPYRIHPSVLDAEWQLDDRFQDSTTVTGTGVGLGYAWRNMRLEGALVHVRDGRDPPYAATVPKLMITTASRLSYRPSPDLTFQLARGHLSRQSVTDMDDEARTSLAASYNRSFAGKSWQTILAFGRNSGRPDAAGSSKVYLMESSMRIGGAHTVFARIERASASELFTDRDALHGQNFDANRATLGYVYAIPLGARSQMTFGSSVSRRSMPQEAAAVLGGDPPSYKVFMRMSLQMP